jgi:hypothetical protein
VPARARAGVGLRVGEQLSTDRVEDPALETGHGLLGLLALGFACVGRVRRAVGVEMELGDRSDVDHVIHPSVPGAREAMAVPLAGGCVPVVRCRSRTRTGCGGEAGDVPEVG